MMANFLFNLVLFVFVQYASTQLSVDRKPDFSELPEEVSDPVSKLLNELGLLILDVDEAFSEHTAPKVALEDGVKERKYGRPRSDYFGRIRDNYKTLLRRVGSLNLGDSFSLSSGLFGVNVKNENQRSSVDVSVPSLPVQIRLRSENPSVKESGQESANEGPKIQSPESSFAGKIKVGDAEMKIYSTFTVSPDAPSEGGQDEPLTVYLVQLGGPDTPGKSRRERDTPLVKRASDDLVSLFAQDYRDFLSETGSGPEDPKSEDAEVKLEDVAYSKSEIETRTQEAIRNAKLAVDSDLPPSEIIDMLDEVAKLVLARRRKPARKISPEIGASVANPGGDAEATRIGKFERSVLGPVDSAKPTSEGGSAEEVAETRSATPAPPQETVLSAYTNSGVPVRLRIGPEAGDPYRFLHRILSSHEVTLNVQMKVQSGIEPIGKVVPHSGAESGELPSDALYIDLSDVRQRNSFMQALRKFKTKLN